MVTLSSCQTISVKFAGSLIYAYYLNDDNGNEVVEINRDTIKARCKLQGADKAFAT